MTFVDTLKQLEVEKDSLALIWAGQAGFILKTAAGKLIGIDPYTTDYVYDSEREYYGYGYKRLTAPLYDSEDIKLDYLFISHQHGDHLDIPALPGYLKYHNINVYVNEPSMTHINNCGIKDERIHQIAIGDEIDFGEFKLYAVDSDHGPNTPFALGFILDFGFTKVYYSGDTGYSLDRLKKPLEMKPEIALLPINGAFGNLNHETAAEYANKLGSKICFPHHFWTFALHGGDPQAAIDIFPKLAPDCECRVTTPGMVHIIK